MSNDPQISLLTAQEVLLTSRNTKIKEEVREDEIKISMTDHFAATLYNCLIQYKWMQLQAQSNEQLSDVI